MAETYQLRVDTQICTFCDWNETQTTFMRRDTNTGVYVIAKSAPEAGFACEVIQLPVRHVPICQRCARQRGKVHTTSQDAAWQATLKRKREQEAQAKLEAKAKTSPAPKPAPTLGDIL